MTADERIDAALERILLSAGSSLEECANNPRLPGPACGMWWRAAGASRRTVRKGAHLLATSDANAGRE